ncbi:ABC transporter permease [Leptolyngbya sp. FACHB-261]|uniref:ABC transporter permease n=1 Tax=Leptolyngbya sp. FACHB-261 TaxID=2692806 RepID=UPI001687EE32|nr:ABC transporter permease [Leptolyngbya sp. FACHB-261]MBD2104341.1 ABC transporter permease [Leptolyngbya sp. FACHB-261]
MNPGRVLTIAANVFRETIRDRVLYLPGFFAVLLVACGLLLPHISAGAEDKILLDVGLAAIGVLGLVVAIFVGTGLVNKEIEKRTVFVLIAKPMSRAEFIVGKHLGLSAVLAVIVAMMTAVFLAVAGLRLMQGTLSTGISLHVGPILVSSAFVVLELALLVAVALLFGVFTSSLLASLFSFGVYIMGHLSTDLLSLAKLSKNATIEQVAHSLYLVLPNLSLLDLKNQAVHGILPPSGELLLRAFYALAYTLLLLAVAVLVFSEREI